MRLIDADELKIDYGFTWDDITPTHEELYALIDRQPTIEPERKKGKWIRENIVLTSNPPQYKWHCSECGRMVHWFTAEVLTDYCPNCGADMRGD